MPFSIFRKRTRNEFSDGTGNKDHAFKPRKKSIFRRKASAQPSIQPADTWSLSDSSSFDTLEPSNSMVIPLASSNNIVLPIATAKSEETSEVVPKGFEHLVETTAPNGDGLFFMQKECEALVKRHEAELSKMKENLSVLQTSKEMLEVELQVSNKVTLEQEIEIQNQKEEIKALKDTLAASKSQHEEEKKEYDKELNSLKEALATSESQRTNEKKQNEKKILSFKKKNSGKKSDEVMLLNQELHSIGSRHAEEVSALKADLAEKENQVNELNQQLTATNEHLAQTTALLIQQKPSSSATKAKPNNNEESTSWTLNPFDIF